MAMKFSYNFYPSIGYNENILLFCNGGEDCLTWLNLTCIFTLISMQKLQIYVTMTIKQIKIICCNYTLIENFKNQILALSFQISLLANYFSIILNIKTKLGYQLFVLIYDSKSMTSRSYLITVKIRFHFTLNWYVNIEKRNKKTCIQRYA